MFPISFGSNRTLSVRLTGTISTPFYLVCTYAETNPEKVVTNTYSIDTTTTDVPLLYGQPNNTYIVRQIITQNLNSNNVTLEFKINGNIFHRVTLEPFDTFTLGGVYDQLGRLKTGIMGPPGPPAPTELIEVAKTADYTLQLTDALKFVTFNSSSACTLTVPTNSNVAFPVGTQILVGRKGSGTVTVSPASGVTLNGASSAVNLGEQWKGVATLWKYGTNDWWIFGGIAQ